MEGDGDFGGEGQGARIGPRRRRRRALRGCCGGGGCDEAVADVVAGGSVAAAEELEDAAGVAGGDEEEGGRVLERGEVAGVEVAWYEVAGGAPFAEVERGGVVDVGFEGVPAVVFDGPGAGGAGVERVDAVVGVVGGDHIGVADLAGAAP